ncbi:MAG: UDP-N-acetylmuramoyl-L-alanine--D-glutamate ligase [Kiritimatiellales bacterium]|nr:UDP-N-acetylmuramoyl-L-alanine--D-glutamate ligase [Kiritimatiellales bacterium]
MENYRTALILGYGRSGKAAERLLQSEGTETMVFSEENSSFTDLQKALAGEVFDVCVVSPGFALSHPWLIAVCSAGIPLLSELELGWSRRSGKVVAVTGSNGKSTAVKWIAESLQQAGLRAAIGGNYGVPVSEVVMDEPVLDWLVIEVSSFQLETAVNFRADAGVLLNVLPNHLDRHGTMENYRQTKARMFRQSVDGDCCIVPYELSRTLKADAPGAQGRWITFGADPAADYSYRGGMVFRGEEEFLDLNGTPFANEVLGGCTGAAVGAVMGACGIGSAAAVAAARRFTALPHRLQTIAEIDGVKYINDSKATNLAAIATALQACGNRIHLIAGGRAKESDFTFIKEILAERVSGLYLIGEASRTMEAAWKGVCPSVECGTMEEAVNCARAAAKSGDTVLLSPGCASFDQFQNFEQRGERFAELVGGSPDSGGASA